MSEPGIRFSVGDAVVLLVGIGATIALWAAVGELAILVPFALGHFFLFCNVFRVRRSYELLWATAFAVNFVAWVASGTLSWWGILAVQTPVTILLIALEVRSPRYHGVFSKRSHSTAADEHRD